MKAVLIPGDGIGREIAESVREVSAALNTGIEWQEFAAGAEYAAESGELIAPGTLDAIEACGWALKGPTATPIGKGFRSINVQLRQRFNTYANLRPVRTLPGVPTRFENVDLVIVRENTEDLYKGIEYMLNDEIANGVKLITKPACERICRFAFDYAAANGRKKVTAVHKANIMKLTDGMFLSTFREVAKDYPAIEADDCIIDALCMKLVQKPEQFDVLVAPNLYGDIISDLCAGLVGGLGFAPSANIGAKTRIYEAVHGSAPDIAGQDKANPSAILMAFAMMLNDLGETDKAAKLNAAILAQVEEGKVGWTDMMADFYAQFVPWLEAAKNSDLPPADEAAALLSLFDHVTFEAAQKVGKRTYDDGKFCRSLREKFDSDGKITARQYQALISLAAKYSAQLETGLKALPEKLRNAVEAAAILRAEREENRERSEAACASSEYPALFAAFDKVNFEPVTKRGRFSYDDRKFFDSLRKQALSGRALSEKQLGALRKLAQKYRGELTDPALVDRVLGMEAAAAPAKEEGGAAGETAAAPVASPETERLLEGLKAVTQWAEPVKRGRFTYDDKAFYESLAKQYAAGRRFSEKQQAALAKMAAKYGVK